MDKTSRQSAIGPELEDSQDALQSAVDIRANTTWWLVILCSFATTLCGMELMLTNGNMIYIVGSIGITPDEATWIIAGFFFAQMLGIALSSVLWRCLTVRYFLLLMSMLYMVFELVAAQSSDVISFGFSRMGAGFVNGSLTSINLILIMRKIPSDRRRLAYFFFGTPPILTVPGAFILGGLCITNTSWRDMYYISAALQLLLFIGFYVFSAPSRFRLHLISTLDPRGLLLLILFVGSFTVMMMRGTTENWLDSPFIQSLLLINLVSAALFIYSQVTVRVALLNLRLCKDLHFLAIVSINFMFGSILAYTFVVSGFLVLTQDYNSVQIGLAVFLAAITAPFPIMLQKNVDPRLILVIGILFFTASGLINANVTRLEDSSNIIVSQVLRSIGQTFLLWPLWTLTISGVKHKNYEQTAKIYTFSRSLGVVTGIAAIAGFQLLRANFHSVHVMETLNDAIIKSDIAILKPFFIAHGSTAPRAAQQALGLVVKRVRAENGVLVYGDVFWLIGITAMVAFIPLIFVRGNSPYSIFDYIRGLVRPRSGVIRASKIE